MRLVDTRPPFAGLANLPNSNIFVFSSASSSPYLAKRSSSLCLNIFASYWF